MRHGYPSGWDSGCRCSRCVVGHQAREQRRRDELRGQALLALHRRALTPEENPELGGTLPPEMAWPARRRQRHGTIVAYDKRGCRCPECVREHEYREGLAADPHKTATETANELWAAMKKRGTE